MSDQTEPEKPFKSEGDTPGTPAGNPNPPESSGRTVPPTPAAPTAGVPVTPPSAGAPVTPPAGTPATPYTPPPPKRTSAEIRADIDAQRAQLGQSVDQLRDRVTELTDWKSQLRKHRKQIIVGAVATGFVVGGLMALRRR